MIQGGPWKRVQKVGTYRQGKMESVIPHRTLRMPGFVRQMQISLDAPTRQASGEGKALFRIMLKATLRKWCCLKRWAMVSSVSCVACIYPPQRGITVESLAFPMESIPASDPRHTLQPILMGNT